MVWWVISIRGWGIGVGLLCNGCGVGWLYFWVMWGCSWGMEDCRECWLGCVSWGGM